MEHQHIADRSAASGREIRILTWNINGLRKVAANHGGVKKLLDQFEADIVCFQEIKITRAGLVEHELARAEGYHGMFSHCKLPRKVSYSGVATFVRSGSGLKTLASTTSLGDAEFFGSPSTGRGGGHAEQDDDGNDGADGGTSPAPPFRPLTLLGPERLAALNAEGRVLVTDHGYFVLFNVYAPCISTCDEDEKTEERRAFKQDFLATLEARLLEVHGRGRAVVLVGDLNACASQLDHGFVMTDTQFYASNWSKWIRGILGLDSPDPPRLVDCFRCLHPARKDAFTCWNTQTGARENNYGTRIDYIIAGAAFAERALRQCNIMPDVLGSDHCPVCATFLVPCSAGSSSAATAAAAAADSPGGRGEAGGGHSVDDAGGGCGGDDGVASGINDDEWPEHPPECSCFYQELTAKQEKLAKYFVAGGRGRPTPDGGDGDRGGGSSGSAADGGAGMEAGRRGGGTVHSAASSGARRDGGALLRRASPEAAAATTTVATATRKSNAGAAAASTVGSWITRGRKTGGSGIPSGSSSSARGAAARRAGSGSSRQSKLNFGAAAPLATVVRGGLGTGGGGSSNSARGAPSSEATAAGTGASARRAGTGDSTRGSSRAVEERSAGSTATVAAEAARPASETAERRQQPRPNGPASSAGANPDSRDTSASTTTTTGDGDARRVGAASSGGATLGGGGSAEAWKAIFGQKKVAPPCGHGEPSIQRTVLKPGPNYNRRFYTCARSAGDWPTDRNARCNFFQWRRDGVRGYKDRPSRDEITAGTKKRRL